MLLFRFPCLSDLTEDELKAEASRSHLSIPSISNSEMQGKGSTKDDGGEDTSFESECRKLPLYLRSCLDYCCIFYKRHPIDRATLVRLLLAEGLVQEKPGEMIDDTAKKNIEELVSLGMLHEVEDGTRLFVSSSYLELSIHKWDIQESAICCAPSPIWVVMDEPEDNPPHSTWCSTSLIQAVMDEPVDNPTRSKGLFIRSLFCYSYHNGFSAGFMEAVCEMKFLVVLDLGGKIEHLPNEIGELIHLVYLGLKNSGLDELPGSIGNLQRLETLDISMCRHLVELPVEVLGIKKLRHLIMSKSINDGEVRVPKGIRTLVNLHTLSGVYAGGGIAGELSTLTQLRELGVKAVSDDHAAELFASIAKMPDLGSLSLEVEESFNDMHNQLFPSLELFSPPPLVQELCLLGGLTEMPSWIASMENLSKLVLSFSYLYENPSSVLQHLPNLKHLTLWNAYKAKRIGREFCEAGRFAKLEFLTIASLFLVEWTEVEKGAFPSLKYLSLHNCTKLMFLPEGLQYISTLEHLLLLPLAHDLGRRLKGEESYKIEHIPDIRSFSF